MTMLHRMSHDLSTRGDGRTVYGIAMPFDREATVNDGWGDYVEVFRKGSFAKTLREAGNVRLLVNHDKQQRLPIGRATTLREEAAGLYGEFRVSQTRDADEALTLIRDGVVDAFSVGFIPVKENETAGVIERTEVKLQEVSVVAFPAYADAVIGGVRSVLGIGDVEARRLVEYVRDHPELLRELDDDSDTPPDGGAVEPDPDDGAGGEPGDEPTPSGEPAQQEGHSPEEHEPSAEQRSHIERLREISRVAAMVAAASHWRH
jgi:HK97 family phage prohead protease